jgi:hypothetical protein
MSISSNPSSPTSTILTSKGDLLSHSGSSQIRVPVGTNGQYLISDSTNSAGFKWSTEVTSLDAGYSLISATTITADATLVTISSIPQTFKNIRAIVVAQNTAATGTFTEVRISFNTATASNTHYTKHWYNANASTDQIRTSNQAYFYSSVYMDSNTTGRNAILSIDIPNYTSTVKQVCIGYAVGMNAGTAEMFSQFGGTSTVSEAITALTFRLNSTYAYKSGSQFILYGMV